MKNLLFKFFSVIILLAWPFFKVFAQELKSPLKASDIPGVIENATSFLLSLIVPVAVLISLWAAILLMTSGGNANQIKKARQALFWAVIGMAIAMIAQGFISFTEKELKSVSFTKNRTLEKSAGGLVDLVEKVSGYLRIIGGPIAIVMFLYGSLLLGTANAENVKKAYQIFLWTAVAIVIIMIATIPNIIRLLSQLLK